MCVTFHTAVALNVATTSMRFECPCSSRCMQPHATQVRQSMVVINTLEQKLAPPPTLLSKMSPRTVVARGSLPSIP
jgi:hypothetical protein